MKKIYNVKNAKELQNEIDAYVNKEGRSFEFSYCFYFFFNNYIFAKPDNDKDGIFCIEFTRSL